MRALHGIYRARVIANDDPEKRLRVKVIVPSVTENAITDWVWPCVSPGLVNLPPRVGAGAWIMYENGSIDHPVWVGVFENQT